MTDGQYDGRRMIVRINLGARVFAAAGTHPLRVGIAIPLRAPDPTGMPGHAELQALAAFEDAMVREVGDRAVFVATLTFPGVREFVLYTTDGAWLEALKRSLQERLPSHTVQMTGMPDEDWSVFAYLAGMVPRA